MISGALQRPPPRKQRAPLWRAREWRARPHVLPRRHCQQRTIDGDSRRTAASAKADSPRSSSGPGAVTRGTRRYYRTHLRTIGYQTDGAACTARFWRPRCLIVAELAGRFECATRIETNRARDSIRPIRAYATPTPMRKRHPGASFPAPIAYLSPSNGDNQQMKADRCYYVL